MSRKESTIHTTDTYFHRDNPHQKEMTCAECLWAWDFLHFSSYYEKVPCCLLFYLLATLSLAMIFTSLFFGLFEEQNLNYIKNLRLMESVSNWNDNNVSQTFSMFEVGLEVRDRSFYINIEGLMRDPKYNISDTKIQNSSLLNNLVWISSGSNKSKLNVSKNYEPYLFHFSLEKPTTEIFKTVLGHLDFNQFELPLGNAENICGSLKYRYKSENKSSFDADESLNDFKNMSSCSFITGSGSQRDLGIVIMPWNEKKVEYSACCNSSKIKTSCLKESECKKECHRNKGILINQNSGSVCYGYDILREICIQVQIHNKSLQFKGGCYENNEISLYRPAEPGKYHNFNDFKFFVREYRDPYLTALEVGENNKPYHFSKAQFPEISYLLVRSGMTIILILNIIYIAFKLLKKRKYVIYVENQDPKAIKSERSEDTKKLEKKDDTINIIPLKKDEADDPDNGNFIQLDKGTFMSITPKKENLSNKH